MRKEGGGWAGKGGLEKLGQAAWRRGDVSKVWSHEVSKAEMGDERARRRKQMQWRL